MGRVYHPPPKTTAQHEHTTQARLSEHSLARNVQLARPLTLSCAVDLSRFHAGKTI